MKSETIELSQVVKIGRSYFWPVTAIVFLCASAAVAFSFYLPQRFKTVSTLSIQSSYFKNPLVSDLISEEYDHNELRARREALLRMALDDSFIDKLADTFEVYSSDSSPAQRALDREMLRQRIEYFALNPNTYQISVAGEDKQEIFEMNKMILDRMIETLLEQRYIVLSNTREAIESHVEELGATLKEVVASEGRKSPESVRSELQNVNADLQALLLHYSEQHPDVFHLQRKADSLSSLLKAVEKEQASAGGTGLQAYIGVEAKRPIEDVFNELLQKLSYLKIVLDIEGSGQAGAHVSVVEQPGLPTTAFFPNKKLFLLFGIVVGLIFSTALVAFKEVRRLSVFSPEETFSEIGLPFFGSLPTLSEPGYAPLLLDGPRQQSAHRALPWLPLKGR